MAITFTGTSGFTLQGGEREKYGRDGSETRVRTYVGEESELDSFKALWTFGTRHPSASYLTVVDIDVDRSGKECSVTLTFEGAEGADLSSGGERVVGRSRVARSAEISKSGVKYLVQYISPVANVTYISNVDVKDGVKSAFAGIGSLGVDIVSAIAAGAAVPIANVTTAFTENTHYELVTVLDGFSTSPMGKVDGVEKWTVNESWTRVMEQA